MKVAAWARANGVHPQTAYRWFRQGRMPVPARRLPSGTILVEAPASGDLPDRRAALHARVSSHNQRPDLDRQVARLSAWAAEQGVGVAEVVTEVGSGLNGHRPRLRRLLADPTVAMIVVEHRDRLARFGIEYLEAALGRRAVGWWWSTLARPPTTWSVTWSRSLPASALGCMAAAAPATGRCAP